jgi:hypothetical protein
MDITIVARIRKLLEAIDAEVPGGDPREVTLNQSLELLVAQGSAEYEELTRPGRAFWTGTTAAVAAVVAIPTTGTLLALYNAAPDNGKSLIIDWIGASGVAKTAAAGQQQMIGLIGQLREALPTAAALTFKKMNGMGTTSGAVDTIALPVTAALPAGTGIVANWFPIGPSFGSPGAAATPGDGAWQELKGRIIVPPGRYFAIHVIADVVGSTYQGFIGWHEKQIVLG